MASNGHLGCAKLGLGGRGGHRKWAHFFTQIPQPMHKNSEMNAILSEGLTSIHSLPVAHEPGESAREGNKILTHLHDRT